MEEARGTGGRWTVRIAAVAAVAAAVAVPAQAQDSSAGHQDLRRDLQARLDSLVAATGIPGVTLGVALPSDEAFGLAAGWADTARARPMTPEARMLQGSVGKTYFGAVALQLVSEGRLELDAPISDFLGREPWFSRLPNAADVTVRQLMNHTSGIVRYELDPRFLEDLSAEPMRTWTPEDRLAYLLDSTAPFPAGEAWDYSDTNYILLAMILERITGTAAYDEVQSRLLDPLGLDDTVRSDRPDVPGLVQGYAGPENPFGGFDEMLVDGRLAINPQFEWAGGGYASSARDLARWARFFHEGEAFDPALLEEARRGEPAPLGPMGEYGLAVIMMELPAGTAWGHSGFMPGYRTEMYYFPEGGFAVALQINSSDPAALDGPLLLVLSDLAAAVAAHLQV
jgi:D-alanyl-D-alanine carboxypeptidase